MRLSTKILAVYVFFSTVELARCETFTGSGRQVGLSVSPAAAGDDHEIRLAAIKALRGSGISLGLWSVALSRIHVKRVLVRDECADSRHPAGCTTAYVLRETGEPYAVIWYVAGHREKAKVLLHEFRHAIAYVTGDPAWAEKGHAK
jgi:hypothetical protein